MHPFPSSTLPPPDATFTIRELSNRTGVSIRTIRHYIAEKLLPAPEFRSSKTRYSRAFLIRLRASMTLRRRGLHVNGVREALASTSPEELVRLAGYDPPPPAAAEAAPSTPPAPTTTSPTPAGAPAPTPSPPAPTTSAPPTSSPVRSLPPGFLGPYRPEAAPPHERWDHFELCPGVKLLVRGEANPEAWRVAHEIVSLFGPQRSDA